MAYELHIVRPPFNDEGEPIPIPLDEWKTAIAAIQGVRLFAGDAHTITNPATGEVISVAKRDGDAEVYYPAEGKWISAFRWFDGSAKFNARFTVGDLSNPVWIAAVALASRLDAVIRGDDGELYNLKSGEPIAGTIKIEYPRKYLISLIAIVLIGLMLAIVLPSLRSPYHFASVNEARSFGGAQDEQIIDELGDTNGPYKLVRAIVGGVGKPFDFNLTFNGRSTNWTQLVSNHMWFAVTVFENRQGNQFAVVVKRTE